MQRFRFPIAVGVTSLALVLILIGIGGLLVGQAFANSPLAAFSGHGGPPWTWSGNHNGSWQASNLPPELTGLADVPADQRFGHFKGVQLQLTDKNNQPLTVNVTPGTATAVSATSVTLAANDGSTQTFAIDANTIVHSGPGAPRPGTSSAGSPNAGTPSGGTSSNAGAPKAGQDVVVVSLNGSHTAMAVFAVDPTSMGPRGPFGH